MNGAAALLAAAPVVIGVLAPGSGPLAPAGIELARGAEVAAARANAEGGVRGRPVRLVRAGAEGPWRAATGDLVRLIYGEGAVAVVGALDGRTGHLAEQVITRARGRAVFVAAWASEATLTRIRIPWFFSIVPDDPSQAQALAGEIFSARGVERAAAWVDGSFDARAAAEAFLAASPPGAVRVLREGGPAVEEDLAGALAGGEAGALVLFAAPEGAARAALIGRAARPGVLLAAPLGVAASGFLGSSAAEGCLIAGASGGDGAGAAAFEAAFERAHGAAPGEAARYGHDAVAVLVEALRRADGTGGPALAEALARTSIEGVAGRIRFDERRGREGPASLGVARGGRIGPRPASGGGAGR